MEYTSLETLKKDIIKETGKIYEVDYFYFNGLEILWGNTWEEPRPVYSMLKCRPKDNKPWTKKNMWVFEGLKRELKDILPVRINWH